MKYTRYVALCFSSLCLFLSCTVLIGYFFPTWMHIITAFCGICLLLIAAIAYDFFRLLPSDVTYDVITLATLYLVSLISRVVAFITYQRLIRASRHLRDSQETLLLSYLRRNQATAYGKDLSLETIHSREEFKKRIPLSDYDDIKAYVQRSLQGERGVITGRDIILFATTSGTTSGTRKLLPVTNGDLFRQFCAASIVLNPIPAEYFPNISPLRKTIRLYHKGALQSSPVGVPVGPVSSFTNSKMSRMLQPLPEAAMLLDDSESFDYVTWLFCLADQSVGSITAIMASQLYTEFEFLMNIWQELVSDLKTGKVSARRVPDAEIRRKLESTLRSDPERATVVRREFLAGAPGLARRLWPRCEYVLSVCTGAMEVYSTLLKESYCRGMPMYSPLYVSSEAAMGINLWPLKAETAYLPNLHGVYFELIPMENTEETNPPTYFLDEAEYGKEYEIVLTTESGLYRYRNGDVIRIAGFHNQCPIFEFRYRLGQIVDIAGEKTSEPILYEALSRACAACGDVTLVDYTTTVSALFDASAAAAGDDETRPKPPAASHYIILVELSGKLGAPRAEELSNELDRNLCELSEAYSRCRQRETLAAAVVHLVSAESFREFADFRCRDLTSAHNQFKMPRYIIKPEMLDFFKQRLQRKSEE